MVCVVETDGEKPVGVAVWDILTVKVVADKIAVTYVPGNVVPPVIRLPTTRAGRGADPVIVKVVPDIDPVSDVAANNTLVPGEYQVYENELFPNAAEILNQE
jgi:hypothetical protein